MILHLLSIDKDQEKASQLISKDYYVYSNELKTPINTYYKPICHKKKWSGTYYNVSNIDNIGSIESYLKIYPSMKPGRMYLLALKIVVAKYLQALKAAGLKEIGGMWILTPEPMIAAMQEFVDTLDELAKTLFYWFRVF